MCDHDLALPLNMAFTNTALFPILCPVYLPSSAPCFYNIVLRMYALRLLRGGKLYTRVRCCCVFCPPGSGDPEAVQVHRGRRS